MPNVLSGKVINILSGPTLRSMKVVTIRRTWEDGIFKGESEAEPYERQWWEVTAIVDEEWIGEKEKTFECASPEKAAEIVPGYMYNF